MSAYLFDPTYLTQRLNEYFKGYNFLYDPSLDKPENILVIGYQLTSDDLAEIQLKSLVYIEKYVEPAAQTFKQVFEGLDPVSVGWEEPFKVVNVESFGNLLVSIECCVYTGD